MLTAACRLAREPHTSAPDTFHLDACADAVSAHLPAGNLTPQHVTVMPHNKTKEGAEKVSAAAHAGGAVRVCYPQHEPPGPNKCNKTSKGVGGV